MIAPQRRTHFIVWRVLAPLVLVGLIIAVGARRARPEQTPTARASGPQIPAGSSP